MTARRIAVTGATGFVGAALVAALRGRGLEEGQLRLLVRSVERARAAGLPAASLVQGDLHDPRALRAAIADAEVVFHVAGAVKARWRREFALANAAGTQNLVAALRRTAPAARLVHVSSLAAAGPSVDGCGSGLPPDRCRPRSHYGESKRQGELAVQSLADQQPWLIVRPPVVYGPGDAATRLLFRQCTTPWVAVPWTCRPLSLLHVRDLVRALLLAAEVQSSRRILPLDGPARLDTDLLPRRIAAACGRRVRLVRVPTAAVWPAAAAADLWGCVTGRVSVFGRDKLRDVRACGWVADSLPAREAIGFTARIQHEVGLRETAEAFGFA